MKPILVCLVALCLSTGLTFKPTGLGSTDLTVSLGRSASVAVEVVTASK